MPRHLYAMRLLKFSTIFLFFQLQPNPSMMSFGPCFSKRHHWYGDSDSIFLFLFNLRSRRASCHKVIKMSLNHHTLSLTCVTLLTAPWACESPHIDLQSTWVLRLRSSELLHVHQTAVFSFLEATIVYVNMI